MIRIKIHSSSHFEHANNNWLLPSVTCLVNSSQSLACRSWSRWSRRSPSKGSISFVLLLVICIRQAHLSNRRQSKSFLHDLLSRFEIFHASDQLFLLRLRSLLLTSRWWGGQWLLLMFQAILQLNQVSRHSRQQGHDHGFGWCNVSSVGFLVILTFSWSTFLIYFPRWTHQHYQDSLNMLLKGHVSVPAFHESLLHQQPLPIH